ncbi:MAG: hypothetical protein IKQ46_06615 [Bacteroidales bacterium]|nr:hypothetical protein [Bacteroidales bacterium]
MMKKENYYLAAIGVNIVLSIIIYHSISSIVFGFLFLMLCAHLVYKLIEWFKNNDGKNSGQNGWRF